MIAGGARLQLLPDRAAYLPEHGTLLIADARIGKAVSFCKLGLPVPAGTTAETLRRLSALVQATGAGHIAITRRSVRNSPRQLCTGGHVHPSALVGGQGA